MDVAKGALRQDVFYAPCASRKTVFCRIFRLSYQRMHRLKRDYLSQIPYIGSPKKAFSPRMAPDDFLFPRYNKDFGIYISMRVYCGNADI